MALSKEDIALFEELIADPSVPDEEKKIYKDALSQAKSSDEPKKEAKKTPAKAKPKTRKKTAKKPKEEDIEKAKAEILKRTGKTQEECEKIVDEYKALRRKATTRKKKETAQKEQAKKRTTKLKKEGKTIEGTTEKNVEATLETTTEKVVKKIDKEVDKIEKTSKTEKQVEKKLNSLVAKAVKQNKKLFSDTAKELRKANPTEAKRYLMSLRNEIDKLLKDYEYGGEVFDGSGDIVNYGSGGYTQPLNIQEGLISTGNNVQFAKGGFIEDVKITFKRDTEVEILDKNGIVVDEENYKKGEQEKVEVLSSDNNFLMVQFEDGYVASINKEDIIENKFAKGGKVKKLQVGKEYYANFRNQRYNRKLTNFRVVDIFKNKDDIPMVQIITEDGQRAIMLEEDLMPKVEFAKGGKTQGYDDRLDDSLGMRRGRRSTKKQNYKDRRDESKGMEKGMRRRPYSSVGTMDMEDRMMLKKGGRLYDNLDIDEGAFTKEAEKRNMTTKEFMNKVLANKKRYSMKIQKQAQLMKNMGN